MLGQAIWTDFFFGKMAFHHRFIFLLILKNNYNKKMIKTIYWSITSSRRFKFELNGLGNAKETK
jgi:hypothetical protein